MGASEADTSHAGPFDPQTPHGPPPPSSHGTPPPRSRDESEPTAGPDRGEPASAHAPRPEAGAAAPVGSHGHVGEVIANRFRLVARIHTSSTGAVYRAEDLSLARPVALRLLTPILSRDTALLGRLQDRLQTGMRMARDEVRVLGDIVDLIDLGRSDSGQVFVVTDFIHGENLAEQLSREGPLPWTAIRPLMVRACQILHLSHEHGVVRLDLQTRHLFPVRDKTQTSTLKILSPGLQLDPALSPEMIRYAAPEQITRAACDRRTDIYALGVIMYELLTGQVPFADAVPAVILARHLLEPPPPLPVHLQGEVPPAVLAIVHRALAKQPAERWPTMKAMANAMAAIDFGPCDVSGMLEVVDGEPVLPSTSSASMHIDPAASHGASTPAVRPRTFPPLQDAFSDGAAYAPSEPSAVLPPPSEPSALTPPPSERASSPGPDASSRMAWEEILAAAEEAIAIVATAERSSGTAGDSGVFIPESLLRTGGAASASQVHGRRPTVRPEPSLAETVVLPMSLVRPDAPTEPTMQLGPEDFMGSSASLSAARLPLGPEDLITTASYPVVPKPPPLPIDERITTAYPTVAAAVTAALETSAAATSESAPHTRSGEHVDDSTTTLRVHKAERPAGVWPREAPRERSPWLAWAAGLLLLVGGGLTVARLTGSPTNDLADRTAANRTARRAEPAARPALPGPDLSPGTSHAADPNLPPRTGPGAPTDLAPGTAAPHGPLTPTAVIAAPPLPGAPDATSPAPSASSSSSLPGSPDTAFAAPSASSSPRSAVVPDTPPPGVAAASASATAPGAASPSNAATSSTAGASPGAASPRNAGTSSTTGPRNAATSSTTAGPRNAAAPSSTAARPRSGAATSTAAGPHDSASSSTAAGPHDAASSSTAAHSTTAPTPGTSASPAGSASSPSAAAPSASTPPGASTSSPPASPPPGASASPAPASPPPAGSTPPAPHASDLPPGTAPPTGPAAVPGAPTAPPNPGSDLSAKTAPPAAPAPQAKPAPSPNPAPPNPQAPGHATIGGHDPLLAAKLLQSAEQSAARGQHSQALGLATQSFHAAPSARSLQVAGEAACRLGNVVKAKWARQHLSAGDRKPVEAACAAAGVVLD